LGFESLIGSEHRKSRLLPAFSVLIDVVFGDEKGGAM
jgi:hypothetical protein